MSNMILAGLAVTAFALTAAPIQAQGHESGSMRVTQAWVRAAPPGAPTMAGYVTLTNRGPSVDHLLGGSSPDFSAIEVHQMTLSGQIMRMRPVVGGLAIGRGRRLSVAPGGEFHLMLIGPKRAFKVGDRIPATLRFEKAGAASVTFVVRDAGAGTIAPQHPMKMP